MSPDPRPNNERDEIVRLGGSEVQHGPLSDRAYLMKLAPQDAERMPAQLDRLAREQGYSKVFAKVPDWAARTFAQRGYATEAEVPGMDRGRHRVLFMGRYFAPWRKTPAEGGRIRKVLRAAREKARENKLAKAPEGYALAELGPEYAEALAGLYGRVFESYPFPVDDPAFLRRGMARGTRFFGAWYEGRLAAAASAEVDAAGANAEMTDFATEPGHRSRGLAGALLRRMERELAQTGLATLYTIARARSYGMNITFARAGYVHAGTLPNNTNISGGLESMNVWFKRL